MYRRLSVVCWLWFLLFPTIGSIGLCQDERTDATKRILVKMVAERAKLVQYACDVRITSNSRNAKLFMPEGISEVRYQDFRSTIDKYWVQVLHFVRPGTIEPDGGIYGSWGPKTIFGGFRPQTQPNIVMFDSYTGKNEPNQELLVRARTDFRAIGLGLLADQRRRNSLEDLEASLLAKPDLHHIPRNDGVVRIRSDGSQILDIDTKRGYWPVYSKSIGPWEKEAQIEAEWRIELDMQNDCWVPKIASLKFEEVDIAFEFTWKAVNEPIEIGRKGVQAIADEYRIPFVDRTVEIKN